MGKRFGGGVGRVGKSVVTKITPSGQIVLENGDRFKRNGHAVGHAQYGSIVCPEQASEARQDLIAFNNAMKVMGCLETFKFNSQSRLTNGQLEAATALISELRKVLEQPV
jgi:hypothetical protein